jgi:hypothetical protein
VLLVGSDDGVYRIDERDGRERGSATKLLDAGRTMRLRTFPGVEGVFAATTTGLYRSTDGDRWTDLGVPRERVYAVGVEPSAGRLLAGTRPAHVYTTDAGSVEDDGSEPDWRELDGFRALPSRDEWRLPRHENLAEVRDLHADPGADGRIVAGVEVGGVHVGEDGGETWTERREGVDDDVHELRVVGAGAYVAATGFGLFRTTDAGRSWERLDGAVEQRHFRAVAVVGDETYASAVLAHSATWNDPDTSPKLFAVHDGSLSAVPVPDQHDDETVTGMTGCDGDLVAATHRGTLLAGGPDRLRPVGEFPVSEEPSGRYTPVVTYDP